MEVLDDFVDKLIAFIKHGDEEHQKWLETECLKFKENYKQLK